MKKNIKQNIALFIIIFIISIITCSAFLKPHYTHDTYKIIRDGYSFYSYDKFLKEARPFTAALTILAAKINLPIENYMLISFVLAVAILSIAVIMLYNIFKKKFDEDNKLKIILIMVSYLMVFSYLTIEHIYYLECAIMSLGILASVYAAKIFINDEKNKYIKCMLILIVGAFCYQGSIAIFPMIVMAYYFLNKQKDLKTMAKTAITAGIMYVIPMLLTVIYVKVIFKTGSRIAIGLQSFNLLSIVEEFKRLVVSSLGVLPNYTHIIIILVTSIILLKNQNDKNIVFRYLFIIIFAIGMCLIPVILGTGLQLTARMCISFGSTIGISLLYLLYIKPSSKIIYVAVCIIFILNLTIYALLTNQHIKVNKLDKELCAKIQQLVEKYEEETEVEIKRIAAVYTKNRELYFEGFIEAGPYTERGTGSWAVRETIIYYLNKQLYFAPISSEQFRKYFGEDKWDEFSEEQIVFENDIMYVCVY